MKKIVLTFGLISGLIISVLMCGSLLLADKIASGHSMALGYTIMVASFLLIYLGIRSYRDNTLAGPISFVRAFACGILITLMESLCGGTGPDIVTLSDDFAGMERKSYFRVTRSRQEA